MQTVALCDANVLYPSTLRDFLLRLALERIIRIYTTEQILDEAFNNLWANRPDLDPARLQRTRCLMIKAVPDLLVSNYEEWIEHLDLPDPDDRHVLAAAIAVGADVIVTSNLKDFPARILTPYGIVAQEPDEFLSELHEIAADEMESVIQDMVTAWRSSDATIKHVFDSLAKQVPRTTERMRRTLSAEN